MKRTLVVFLCCLVVCGAVGFQAAKKLVINGKAVAGEPVVIKGETYIPLKSLKAAGATAVVADGTLTLTMGAAGGAGQVSALEGSLNEWLFNGIWRLRVTAVRPNDDGRPGWLVDVELRNGTTADSLALDGTGFQSVQLVMDDANILPQPYNITDFVRPVGQGSSINTSLRYYDDDGGGRKPVKLIVRIAPDDATKRFLSGMKLGYTVPDPSFRINLQPR
ncbi:MAG: hypothetical protein M3R13_05825 [Armatimonadota bacterium]|nr:hypothetical protein [Armatimonadota bacterium]